MKKIKYVIFDFDGTIGDTMPYTLRQLFLLLKEEKVFLTEKKIINDFKKYNFIELMKRWKISPLRLPFILRKIRISQENLFHEIENIKTFSGMKKLFNELVKRNCKLAILSSNLQKNVDKYIEINNFNYFDFVYCDPSFMQKDKMILKAIKKHNLKINEILYVGDEIRDVIACHKMGVKIIGVSWGLHSINILKKAGADYIVNKPSEILKIINKN